MITAEYLACINRNGLLKMTDSGYGSTISNNGCYVSFR